MIKIIKLLKEKYLHYREKHSHWYIIKHTAIIVVGFLFSPLSWWNDIFINFPVAWFFAWLPLRLISFVLPIDKSVFIIIFIINYWITNVVGLAMMHYSGKKLVFNESKISLINDVLIAIAYTAIVAIVFFANPNNTLTSLHLLPAWLS